MSQARVLIVAGSDSGGGAGIQADIKTVTCLGGYAMTAVTAVTVQNALGVRGIHVVPGDVVAAQMRACIDDTGADVVKIGMPGDAGLSEAVAEVLRGVECPVVLDPVMVATSGDRLLEDDALWALVEHLVPRATVITPNLPELMELTETEIEDAADMLLAAQELLDRGPRAVLAKGGHLPGDRLTDWLVWRGGQRGFSEDRIDGRDTHGTGCTLASGLAVSLAQGLVLEDAVVRARAFVRQGLLQAPGLGRGHGPLGFYPFE
ncbi:hydroxymethylpyrimidine/phosphomethylpyrimidine kinase [Polymorphobacter multimanifer]|uniref:bifunctional hydroxymethylpyrimidine kinase/phosphomethylpyrimidine kinase n=1 Tax=Polymorphobacter multimanifer TaxID=1070431 RepID=UPI00166E3599|nr:bifunctional hydroxymethylpyrimidine kinase/phosphomethylpyrimidine kinase [Polymorphobacter multimanifer]GGI92623.1 hydroxymethylpyrimidine/phosphomethylpyrimidine kinase [Polymorphobacter multimanifer]